MFGVSHQGQLSGGLNSNSLAVLACMSDSIGHPWPASLLDAGSCQSSCAAAGDRCHKLRYRLRISAWVTVVCMGQRGFWWQRQEFQQLRV